MNFLQFLKDVEVSHEPIFFDGAMGTMILAETSSAASGASYSSVPEELNLTAPELIMRIHREYLEAGCDVITANTFGANPLKLAGSGYKTEEVIKAAVEIARQAAETSSAAKSSSVPGKKYVALDMGPTGKLLEPMGTLSFDDAYESFRRCAVAGEEAGADLVIIETMSDLYETKAAVLAVRENTRLPVIACVTFQDNGRMLTGADALTAVTVLESFGADAVGFNCVGDLSLAQELAETFLRYARVPVIVQPNAGIPVLENGKTVFRISPAEFASAMQSLAAAGVRITGGCCGTTPEHIAEVIRHCRETVLSALPPLPAGGRPEGTRISSFCRTETIGGRAGTGDGPRIIGERINPTGKKRLKQALSDGDMQYILNEGAVQVEAGAHILDVNVGLPGTDEAALMVGAVRELQRALPVPLQLDSSDPAVLERGLRYYNGKALVNSVNGKRSSMDAVFPLIRKYGGAVIALALDETGIPDTAAGRLAIARRILGRALEYGISPSDIIVDPLTLTVSSNQDEAKVTLEAVRMIKAELGLPTVLGVSNISFGLPQRELITSTFLALALEAGLDACIINPCSAQIMGSWYSWRVLAGYDRNSLTYIEKYTGAAVTAVETAPAAPKAPEQEKKASGVPSSKDETPPSGPESELRRLIVGGFREQSSAVTGELLKKYSPVEIIDRQIVPALDEVGRDFESGKKFLPQLLLSADTVAAAFDVIKAHLERSGQKRADKGTVLLATVYGDIHDIGKNIVKAMLENYGYTVIDMGKNVEPQAIVDCIRENAVLGKDIPLVGLSALMTTTVSSMEQTIQAIREADLDTKIMVGGAVLTADYAEKIGADYYAKDAMASVAIAKTVFKELSDK